jgi:hypothetical protein
MGSNLGQLGSLSLRELLLPGSHDSGAYMLTNALAPAIAGSDEINALIVWAEAHGIPFNAIITPWALAQRGTIREQLEAGVRYIDLRICYNGSDFFTYHFQIGPTIQTLLDDMHSFLQAHPHELLVVEAQLWQPTNSSFAIPPEAKKRLAGMMLRAFEGLLIPLSARIDVPYATLLQANKRVLVTVHDPLLMAASVDPRTGQNLFWPGAPNTIFNTYANNSTLAVMRDYDTRRVLEFNSPLRHAGRRADKRRSSSSSSAALLRHARSDRGLDGSMTDADPPIPPQCKRAANNSGCLFKLSWTLTTDLAAIWRSITDPHAPGSLLAMAALANENFLAWMHAPPVAGLRLGHILIADDVTNPANPVVPAAIKQNLQRAAERRKQQEQHAAALVAEA